MCPFSVFSNTEKVLRIIYTTSQWVANIQICLPLLETGEKNKIYSWKLGNSKCTTNNHLFKKSISHSILSCLEKKTLKKLDLWGLNYLKKN